MKVPILDFKKSETRGKASCIKMISQLPFREMLVRRDEHYSLRHGLRHENSFREEWMVFLIVEAFTYFLLEMIGKRKGGSSERCDTPDPLFRIGLLGEEIFGRTPVKPQQEVYVPRDISRLCLVLTLRCLPHRKH